MAGASPIVPVPQLKDILRVEGPDDKGVLVAILRYLGTDDKVQVKDSGGIDNLLAAIPVELKGSDLGRLGIVVDADDAVQPRWDALRHILTAAGYGKVPRKPATGGTILRDADLPVVGIWIMPDNQVPGAIEHFVHSLISTGDALWPLAEATIQSVVAVERRFVPAQEMKASVHTWLAWQEEPGRPMGQAITKRYLDPASPHADALCDWLRKLFAL